ncbi:hypothetical protein C8F01DRAFT_1132902 [Mycena amicta]|nr:hypothetical protein C8F01DRAFT_1132902 [Mycena amicta]
MNLNADHTDFDYWDFVACARCQLPFASESGSTVPFWLTECGHVVCNAHLNSDQSCAQCGATGIQLVPLQPQFQQETMAFQIRYYKSRQQQQRSLIERLKRDVADLRRTNEVLSHENTQFRQQFDVGPIPSDFPNPNGKRPMLNSDRYRPTTSSSRSDHTPHGPDRLTLPPGQQPPSLSSNRPSGRAVANQERPGSSRFIEKYTYAGPPAHHHPQQLSYSQSAPRRAKQNIDPLPAPRGETQSVTRFKPAQNGPSSDSQPARAKQPLTQMQNQSLDSQPRNMGPPPTPQLHRGEVPMSSRRDNSNNRSLPPAQRFALPTPVVTPSTSGGAAQRFSLDTSHGPRGAQRAPFVPRGSGGFG